MKFLDKFLMIGMVLIVIAIFTLAIVMYSKGGKCVVDPCQFVKANNLSCFVPNFSQFLPR